MRSIYICSYLKYYWADLAQTCSLGLLAMSRILSLRLIHAMHALTSLATQQCINFYFRGNISSFMTENNSSRFFWTLGTIMQRTEFSCFVPHFSLLKYNGCHQLVT